MDKGLKTWLGRVDKILLTQMGVTHRDIADRNYWDMWDSGATPEEVVADILSEGIDAL